VIPAASLGRFAAFQHVFPTSSEFWFAWAMTTGTNAVSSYLYMSVLATAELSLVLPLVTLTPVFLLITAPLITHEFPSWMGLVGIVVTTVGVYGLKFEDRTQGFWKPFTNLWRDDRTRKMLAVAALWAISSPFDKRSVLAGGPVWTTILVNAGLALIYFPWMFRQQRIAKIAGNRAFLQLIPLDLFSMVRSLCQNGAALFLIIPYVIGIKRLSILFGILWAKLLFKENRLGQRGVAATVMLVGTFLILYAAGR
jgi:drug/metabolite transporter (DMT)-like permease